MSACHFSHKSFKSICQASLDEAAPEAETAAAAVDEWDKLMNLAATEQHPRLVGYVRQIVGDIPQVRTEVEKF
jgi:hypothetical protein